VFISFTLSRVCTYIFPWLRWLGHVERMDERIYEADVGGNAGRGRLRRTFLDQFREVLGEGPGQQYPKPASVYEEFDDSGRNERSV
jgi:hypothetical protein